LSTDLPVEQTKIGKITLDQIISKKELQPEINAITREDGKKSISIQADKTNSAVVTDIHFSNQDKVIKKSSLA